MKKIMAVVLIWAVVLGLVGCSTIEEQTNPKDSSSTTPQNDSHFTEIEKENTDLPTASQNESNAAETGEERSDSIILTVVRKIDLQDDTTQLTGEPAEELLSILNSLTYDKETCDGIPEYTVIRQDQTRYDINLTSGWVWLAEKEGKLSPDMIEKLSALLFH